MQTYEIEKLQELADVNAKITRAERDALKVNAVYNTEDEDYFVLKVVDGYAAIVGATLLNDASDYELIMAVYFESRDAAIACAIAWSASDAGGAESTDPRVRDIALYASAWS